MTRLVTADWVHVGGTFAREQALLIDEEGRILAAGPQDSVRADPRAAGAEHEHLSGRALAPGTISAHSHAFQVFLRGRSDHPRSFSDWVSTHLYPLLGRLDDASLEAAALLCFHQMLRAGITCVGEFHYVHNDPGGGDRGAELSELVLRAARRVGLRVAFLSTIYDVAERPGQARMAQSPERSLATIRALAAEWRDDPAVHVLPAPHSLHGATREAIEGGAALARELDVRWHIHLAEQADDVPYAQRKHGARPLQVLENWGVLDERTVLVHGIWLDEGERALLAERGGGVVSNPTTNMALGDGIAPLPDLLARGVRVGLGTDMNAAPNVFQEIRAAEALQRVQALEMGILPGAGAGEPQPARLFELGTRGSAELLGVEAGALEAGRWADVLVIDLDDPSLLPASLAEGGSRAEGDALLNLLSSSMVPETALAQVWVAGRVVSERGEVSGLPRAELLAAVRGAKALRG